MIAYVYLDPPNKTEVQYYVNVLGDAIFLTQTSPVLHFI